MNCDRKKRFTDKKKARTRAVEINKENREKNDETRVRSYFCDECKGYHLSSMTKEEFKKYDPHHRALRRKANFIRRETNYWEQRLGVEL